MEEAIRKIDIICERINARNQKTGELIAEIMALLELTKQDCVSFMEDHYGK